MAEDMFRAKTRQAVSNNQYLLSAPCRSAFTPLNILV